jgi:hypothetical protein
MGGLFSKPKVPKPPPVVPPPPTPMLDDAGEGARREAEAMAKRKGRAASILTGGDAAAPMTTSTKLGS